MCVCWCWQDQITACTDDDACDDMPLVFQLSPDCFGCLVANGATRGEEDTTPPIAPCLSSDLGPGSDVDTASMLDDIRIMCTEIIDPAQCNSDHSGPPGEIGGRRLQDTPVEFSSCTSHDDCGEGLFCASECFTGVCPSSDDSSSHCQPCAECRSDADSFDGSCAACGGIFIEPPMCVWADDACGINPDFEAMVSGDMIMFPDLDCTMTSGTCEEADLEMFMGDHMGHSMSEACMCCMISADDDGEDGFYQCLVPLMPAADFCVDPGNAENNPDSAIFVCMHECEVYHRQGDEEAVAAAGCDDGHEDEVCVANGVYAPGEDTPWGEPCCAWCPDNDGDGVPDYEGCCEGERADGEMGCEDRRCDFMCGGVRCDSHKEQSVCEVSGGTWAALSCADEIADQPIMAMKMQSEGYPASLTSAAWLGALGGTCCTGYEVPGSGSCDGELDLYVSSS